MFISKVIEANENLPFNFENQYKRFSYITFFPMQVNTGVADITDSSTGVTTSRPWFQFVCNYKSNFMSVDDDGVIGEENATVKTLFVKVSSDILEKTQFRRQELRNFFNKYFVGKRFLTLPVTEETPVFAIGANGIKTIVKNQSQVNVYDGFDLKSFILEFEKSIPKK